MFRYVQKPLTEASNHYIDWSRIGELLTASGQRYSRDELIVRGGIIAFTALSGYLGAQYNDEETSGYSDLSMGIAGGLFGFVISHAIVIYPLIKKRMEMRQACDELAKEIWACVDHQDPSVLRQTKKAIQEVITHIYQMSLSDDKHGRASQTWGHRKALLTNLKDYLQENGAELVFWGQDTNVIIDKIREKNDYLPKHSAM